MPFRKSYRRRYRKKPYKAKSKAKAKPKRKYRRYRKVSYRRNQTVQHVFENTGVQREYAHMGSSPTDPYSKQNQLTCGYLNGVNADTHANGLAYNIQINPAFVKACGQFGYVRFKWIKVELIPEKWQASTIVSTGTSPNLTDGEKPEIHWVNDDGSFFQDLKDQMTLVNNNITGTYSIPVNRARQYSKASYKSRDFTKNMKFFIKMYQKQAYDSVKNYTSASRWIRTNPSDPSQNVFWVPSQNFFFGISGTVSDTNVSTNFKYKEHVSFCCEFKQPDFKTE